MSQDNPKVYQGVRVKITVKELLERRKARQAGIKMASEYPIHAFPDTTQSYYKSNTQPHPYTENSTSQGTECSTYSYDFCMTHQTEPVAKSEPSNVPFQHSWPFGKLTNQESDKGQTCSSSLETWTSPSTVGEDIHPIDNQHTSSLFSYTHFGSVQLDPTYGSHFTNVAPYDTPIFASNAQLSSNVLQEIVECPERFGAWYW
ncbi:uncharacterized protein LOC124468336 [Hypomesus transpacificus]|uniref:uncharacterized protein LOC124468336 n=1 Tax=Hypomesus transpacificus TaxID=137520 RepID=UPI001F073965|nr:uncharacterized protein LOC124468336 [Hypomesus transpacificus]